MTRVEKKIVMNLINFFTELRISYAFSNYENLLFIFFFIQISIRLTEKLADHVIWTHPVHVSGSGQFFPSLFWRTMYVLKKKKIVPTAWWWSLKGLRGVGAKGGRNVKIKQPRGKGRESSFALGGENLSSFYDPNV